MRKHEAQMKHIVIMALMLNLGVAGAYARTEVRKHEGFGNECGHYD